MDPSKFSPNTFLAILATIGSFVTGALGLRSRSRAENLARDIALLEQRRQEEQAYKQEVRDRIENLQAGQVDLQREIARLRIEIKDERATTAELTTRVKDAEARAKAAEKKVNNLLIENGKLKKRVTELEGKQDA